MVSAKPFVPLRGRLAELTRSMVAQDGAPAGTDPVTNASPPAHRADPPSFPADLAGGEGWMALIELVFDRDADFACGR